MSNIYGMYKIAALGPALFPAKQITPAFGSFWSELMQTGNFNKFRKLLGLYNITPERLIKFYNEVIAPKYKLEAVRTGVESLTPEARKGLEQLSREIRIMAGEELSKNPWAYGLGGATVLGTGAGLLGLGAYLGKRHEKKKPFYKKLF